MAAVALPVRIPSLSRVANPTPLIRGQVSDEERSGDTALGLTCRLPRCLESDQSDQGPPGDQPAQHQQHRPRRHHHQRGARREKPDEGEIPGCPSVVVQGPRGESGHHRCGSRDDGEQECGDSSDRCIQCLDRGDRAVLVEATGHDQEECGDERNATGHRDGTTRPCHLTGLECEAGAGQGSKGDEQQRQCGSHQRSPISIEDMATIYVTNFMYANTCKNPV